MRKHLTGALSAAVLATGVFAIAPAQAQVARAPAGLVGAQDGLAQVVQYRRGGYGRGYGYRGGYRRGGGFGPGAAIAGGIIGLAAGAAIAGAATAPPVYAPAPAYGGPDGGGEVEYCASRFQSYDPASGTYLGYDGLRHPCP